MRLGRRRKLNRAAQLAFHHNPFKQMLRAPIVAVSVVAAVGSQVVSALESTGQLATSPLAVHHSPAGVCARPIPSMLTPFPHHPPLGRAQLQSVDFMLVA